MKRYEVEFYGRDERGKLHFLGRVEVDNYGVPDRISLPAKAFRQAMPHCRSAILLKVSRAEVR